MTQKVATPLRWGILGTAKIAHKLFLPSVRAAGQRAVAVASRSSNSAERFAAEHGVERPIQGYDRLLQCPDIDAIYIALPNSLHAEWAIRSLEAGKPVLCEKPLSGTFAETERVLAVAAKSGVLLWEAITFPFHPQMAVLREIVNGGEIGELREIRSGFHFRLTRVDDIRLSTDLHGGALWDVGCYPVRLAQELFGSPHLAWARSQRGVSGVDMATWGALEYEGGRRLLFSVGMDGARDTSAVLHGTLGQICLTNPFHPGENDTVTVANESGNRILRSRTVPTFTPQLQHVARVLEGAEAPAFLAVDSALATSRALTDLAASAAGPESQL